MNTQEAIYQKFNENLKAENEALRAENEELRASLKEARDMLAGIDADTAKNALLLKETLEENQALRIELLELQREIILKKADFERTLQEAIDQIAPVPIRRRR